ncbi:leucine-rich melanocyte differentiation-associated protein-like isoform X2 [Gigantopelta aegis]|nr:leucine-rich melanocyte differentiation-associated protein-like isoform X2 [Gigantopelta aegis]
MDSEEIPKSLIDEYCKVTHRLDLSYNNLRHLEGLEHFSDLEELVLDNNQLDDNIVLPHLNSLHTITLNKNKITDLNILLEKLKSSLPNLTYLSLLGNTACPNQLSCSDKDDDDYQRYRYHVLFHLPQLKFLDSSPVKNTELSEAKRSGPFMKVVRLEGSPVESKTTAKTDEKSHYYNPLPQKDNEGQHAGTFGKTKYIYYGRHSEGNRFIRNSDL